MSLDTSHMLNEPDKDALKSIIEQKSKVRILNDELEQLKQRTTETDALRSLSSKRAVLSEDELDAQVPRSSYMSDESSDGKEDELCVARSLHNAPSSKKAKAISFFTEGVPKIETTRVEDIVVGEKKAFRYEILRIPGSYFQLLSKQAANSYKHSGFSVEGKENCLLVFGFFSFPGIDVCIYGEFFPTRQGRDPRSLQEIWGKGNGGTQREDLIRRHW